MKSKNRFGASASSAERQLIYIFFSCAGRAETRSSFQGRLIPPLQVRGDAAGNIDRKGGVAEEAREGRMGKIGSK